MIHLRFVINFGNYIFSGWTPTYAEWSRSGINAPYDFSDFQVEVTSSV